ncbi:hypothetical protein [Halorarius halobius]|uniref:hypothetical protein n=1 Tax=Halorarius halobius TaxID=2962671 RepID=UPI0020CF3D20|nr:hypothetical protein [Halorarius halobius]
MDAGTALEEAVGRLRSRAGLLLLVGFLAVGTATVVARQTLLATSISQYLAAGGDPAALPVDPAAFRPIVLALPVGYGPSLLVFGAVAVVSEYLSVVALRTVAGEPVREAAGRRVGRAVFSGFVVGVLVKTLVIAGLVALVLPGLYAATVLLFAHARVAIEDDGVLAALAESRRVASGRLLPVGVVVGTLGLLYLAPRVAGGLLPAESVGLLVGGLLVGAANLLSSALVARAYVGFRDETPTDDESEDEEDPYDAPLGPDDLPEP